MKRHFLQLRLLILASIILGLLAACRTAELPAEDTGEPLAQAASTDTAVPEAQPTNTAVPSLTPPPTATAMPTSTTASTETASPTAVPPSPTAAPTETPAPPTATMPPPTAEPLIPSRTPEVPTPPLPEWLQFMNRFREIAALPPVTDWEPYTAGSEHHSYYMVINDAAIAHSEDKSNPLYDPAGDQAARNSNIFSTSQTDANYVWGMNFWASAPFHLIGILDPTLNLVGYGDHVEEGGSVSMAAVLDIGSDTGQPNDIDYPVLFPGRDASTWIVRNSLYEWPDPTTSCPGFSRPTGPPIVLFLGDGSGTPRVANHRFARGDTPLRTCIFDETSYSNPDTYAEKVGRTILDLNDAVVIIPREPLAADETYTVQVTANDQTYTWQFHTIKRPPPATN